MIQTAIQDSLMPVTELLQKLTKNHHSEAESDSDEEVNAIDNLDKCLKVNESFALSDLFNPPKKKQKTHHLSPMTTAKVHCEELGTSSYRKCRVLLDSGSSGSIIVEKLVKNLRTKKDTFMQWHTKAGTFTTTKKCKTTFILDEFYENKEIEWNLYVDSSPGPHKYDMIVGRDLLSELGITLNFSDQTVTWQDSTIHMKDPELLSDISSPLHEFFWHYECYESQCLQDASSRLKKILDAKYAPADLDEIVRQCVHLAEEAQMMLKTSLKKYEHLFDGTLGVWNDEPYNIELKEGAKPYHSRPFPVPKIHEQTLKLELKRLCEVGVLKKVNRSEWAAPTFLIPKKDVTI